VIGSMVERALIGSVLLDARALKFAEDEVSGVDFSVGQLEQVWNGLPKMRAVQDPIDALTVGAKLAEWSVRGLSSADLHRMVADTPHALSAGHYAASVRSDAIRRRLRIAGAELLEKADAENVTPSEAVATAIESLRDIQVSGRKASLGAKTLTEVLAGEDEYDWVIPNLLERRDRLMLTGGEGAGKSTFVRQLAILSASGIHPLTFGRIDPVRVLVVDAENSEAQWRRAARFMAGKAKARGLADPGVNVHLACSPRLDLTRDNHLGEVHKLIDEYQPGIVFIGPLYRLTPRAIQTDDDAAPLLAALDTIRDRGIALVMEAHAGHSLSAGGERDLRPRGSSALMGWPEFGLGIRANRASPGVFDVVRWRGDRDERGWPEQMVRGNGKEWPWMPFGDLL
jgi:hypothetical protein